MGLVRDEGAEERGDEGRSHREVVRRNRFRGNDFRLLLLLGFIFSAATSSLTDLVHLLPDQVLFLVLLPLLLGLLLLLRLPSGAQVVVVVVGDSTGLAEETELIEIEDNANSGHEGEPGEGGVEVDDGEENEDSGEDVEPVEDVALTSEAVVVIFDGPEATGVGIEHHVRRIRPNIGRWGSSRNMGSRGNVRTGDRGSRVITCGGHGSSLSAGYSSSCGSCDGFEDVVGSSRGSLGLARIVEQRWSHRWVPMVESGGSKRSSGGLKVLHVLIDVVGVHLLHRGGLQRKVSL